MALRRARRVLRPAPGGRVLRAALLCAGVTLCASCATQPAPAPEVAPGDPDAAPALNALPDVPNGSRCDTPRTHQGLLVAREALAAGLPQPPPDRSHDALQVWIDGPVVAWVEGRRERIEELRQRFELEGEPNDDERIVRHAAIGLLQEDTANALSALPQPAELDSEPEVAAIYREVLAAQAEPFVSSALLEFRDCANLAYESAESMRPWAEFCHARFDRLKAEALARQGDASAAVR